MLTDPDRRHAHPHPQRQQGDARHRRDADLPHEGGDRPPPQGGGLHQGLPRRRGRQPFEPSSSSSSSARTASASSPTSSGSRKPGRRVYARKDRLPRVLGGMGTAILSTSTGLITSRTGRGARHRRRGHRLRLVLHESNRQTAHRDPDRREHRDRPRARSGQRAARRARPGRARADEDRAGATARSSSRARPSAARTGRCTG